MPQTPPPATQTCPRCRVKKPLAQFLGARNPSRVNATCVECINQTRRHRARSQRSLSTIRRAIRDSSPASSRVILGTHSNSLTCHSACPSPASKTDESSASSCDSRYTNSLACYPAYAVACGRDCVVSGHTASINAINRFAARLDIYPLIHPDIYPHLLSSGQEFPRHSRHGLGPPGTTKDKS